MTSTTIALTEPGIRLYPDPILAQPCLPVVEFDQKDGGVGPLQRAHRSMTAVMRVHNGAGLAANQVGCGLSFFVMRLGFNVVLLCNPIVMPRLRTTEIEEEGCLSLPGIYGTVRRPQHVSVNFRDQYGDHKMIELSGWHARVAQHECDHLHGILFPSRVSKKQREPLWRVVEAAAAAGWPQRGR